MTFHKYSILIKIIPIIILTLSINSLFAQNERKVKISGFSGFFFEAAFGNPADEDDAEQLRLLGGEEAAEITEGHTELNTEGLAIVLFSQLHEKLIFQSEIFFTTNHDGLVTHLERFYIDYRLYDKFNIRAGKFLTPIGYLNRNQHTHGYLNKSVLIRDMVDHDKGFIPVEMVGLNFFGDFLNEEGTKGLRYSMSLGSGRGNTPDADVFIAEDNFNFTGLLEFHALLGENTELLMGISGYYIPKLETFNIPDDHFGEELDVHHAEEDFGLVEFKESGIIPFLKLNTSKFELLTEFQTVTMKDKGDLGNRSFKYNGSSTQISLKVDIGKSRLYPYLRYDLIDLPINGGPYYSIQSHEGVHVTKEFKTDKQVLAIGAALDPLPFNRIKFEYQHYLQGPHVTGVFIVASTFAF